MKNKTQLVVIGAGPGGYTAAFLAADQGLDVTLIDKSGTLGGTCLHHGCIPSKTFLNVARIIKDAQESSSIGLRFLKPDMDIKEIANFKNSVIKKISSGLDFLCKQKRIRFITGQATFQNATTLSISKEGTAKETLNFKKCILACGSKTTLPSFVEKTQHILTSKEALDLASIPQTLLVVGGGYIGLEIAQIYQSLGTKVTIWEMAPNILNGADPDLVRVLQKSLEKDIAIELNTTVKNLTNRVDHVLAVGQKNGEEKKEKFEKVLIAVGRQPNTKELGLEHTKIQQDANNFILVNEHFQTAEQHIYAIGDIIGGPLLAHKASAQAHDVMKEICGQERRPSLSVMPYVVYTLPEVAWCGLTEQEAKKSRKTFIASSSSWLANGRALSRHQAEGLTKIIFNKKNQKILGVGLVGVGSDELIAQGTLAMISNLTAQKIASTIFPHPTLSETLKECALSFLNINPHNIKKHPPRET